MIRATYDAERRVLTYDGTEYDMTSDEGLSLVRSWAAEEDVDIAAPMSVYQDGWIAKLAKLHPDDLERYASTMGNQPHYHGHDATRLFGRTGPAEVVEVDGRKRLTQELHYSTPMALETIAHGGDVRASISWAPTEDTQYQCSVCGEEWLSGDCDHYLGDTSEDGEPWSILVTGAVHRETSTTHIPASRGTGSDAGMAYADTADSLMQHIIGRYSARIKDETDDLRTSVLALQTQVSDLISERDSAATKAAELEREQALAVARKTRKEKGLRVPSGMTPAQFEGQLAGLYVNDRGAWDLMVSCISPSQIATQLSGAESAPPVTASVVTAEKGTSEYYSQIAARARELAAQTGEPVADVIRRLKAEV